MLTRADLAKYPFLNEAQEYVRTLGVTIDDVASQGYEPILERAESRLQQAISKGIVSNSLDENVEILSYPVSNLILVLAREDRANRRYALAEAKRAYELLRQEPPEKVEYIATHTFGWKMRRSQEVLGDRLYDFQIGLVDYLNNSVKLKEPKWKLVNRILDHGFVYATRDETARLLEEEVREAVLRRTNTTGDAPNTIPLQLRVRIENVRSTIVKYLGEPVRYELPKTMVPEALPPCVQHLIKELDVGHNVQHMGRFALASFLSNIGTDEEEIVKLFKPASDFSERMTRYQVEHIAGQRGGKTKYTCPMCATLKTHGVCYKPDEICATIRNPLSYYKQKARMMTRGGGPSRPPPESSRRPSK